jgi:N-acetylglutamate synthase
MTGEFGSTGHRAGAPAPIRVGPADVGRRVSLRRVADDVAGPGAPRMQYRDVVGELVSWQDGVLTVRRRSGQLVRVPEALLVAGKVVPAGRPARPGRRPAGVSAAPAEVLEEVAARTWPVPDEAWLGRWWLRAAGGFTGRANAAVPLGDPGMPLDAALAQVAAWYAERVLPVRIMAVVGSPLEAELTARGWRETHSSQVLVQTAQVAAVLDRLADLRPGDDVRLHGEPPQAWLWLYRGPGELPPVARHVLAGHPRVVFATAGDPIAAGGRAAVDGRWAGLTGMEVAAEQRRQGYARLVLRALLEWSARMGAEEAFLQVSEDNAPARGLYAAAGFSTHHAYRYLTPPDSA